MQKRNMCLFMLFFVSFTSYFDELHDFWDFQTTGMMLCDFVDSKKSYKNRELNFNRGFGGWYDVCCI